MINKLLNTHGTKTTPLVEKAGIILESIPLDTLSLHGFIKDKFEYSYVFQYPPPISLVPFKETDIFEYRVNEPYQSLSKMGLYVHIPYCTGTCSFCYFSRYSQNNAPISIKEYINLIKNEINIYTSSRYKISKNIITSIAFGGGTPTCLNKDQLRDLTSYLNNSFNISDEVEFSVESSPETIGYQVDKLDLLLKLKVNRLSIGVQSFEDDLLQSCRRRHNSALAKNAVINAHMVGFKNVNIDLIYGLPNQTLKHWEHTLNVVADINPESVSIYRLRVHPTYRLNNDKYPKEINNLMMYVMAVEYFKSMGYLQVASHNFVRSKKYIQKHVSEKQGIEEFELLGIGLSAYSYINSCHYWNYCSFKSYCNSLRINQLPIWIGSYLSLEERQRKAMVLGMHEYRGVKINEFKKGFKKVPSEIYKSVIEKLVKLDLLSINNIYIEPTYTGMIFADEICTQFYSKNVIKRIQRKNNANRYGVSYIGLDELQCI